MCDQLDALASTGIRMPVTGGLPECVWHNPNRRAALPATRSSYSGACGSCAAPDICKQCRARA